MALNPKDLIEMMLPIEITVKIRIFKTKKGELAITILPIEEETNES